MIRTNVQKVLADRQRVATIDPLEVKRLAIHHGLTQGQIRGLLMAHGRDWVKFEQAARRLRSR
jgi:hypothetical protein